MTEVWNPTNKEDMLCPANEMDGLPSVTIMPGVALPMADRDVTLSVLCELIASGKAQSKAALGRVTGLTRSTITSRVNYLLRKRIITIDGVIEASSGRPANRIAISPEIGVLAIADIGAKHSIFAIADMNLNLLGYRSSRIDLEAKSPQEFLTTVCQNLRDLATRFAPGRPFRHCVLDLPGRIDKKVDRLFRPPIMSGWDMFDAHRAMEEMLGCPVTVENDVNARALGEASALSEEQRPVISVKVATGIGAGIIDSADHILHGFDGSAGELGHTSFDPKNRRRCRCGMTGCLETTASVPAIIASYNERRPRNPVGDVEELIQRLRSGDALAQELVSSAGRSIGQAIAYVCNVLNPRKVVISGLLADNSDELLTEIRTSVYQLTRPLASRNLTVSRSSIGPLAGVVGCMVLGVKTTLSPSYLLK